MGLAAKKTYPFAMSAFKGKLTKTQIQNIAAFVFSKADRRDAGGHYHDDDRASSSGAPARAVDDNDCSAGLGVGSPSTANNGCPAGVTIPTSGSTDNDTDENGDVSDNDGCI